MSADLEQFRAEYEKLRPSIPEFPGEREWPDRLRTWEDFERLGPIVAGQFRRIGAYERERRRAMAPELFELLVRAFPAE